MRLPDSLSERAATSVQAITNAKEAAVKSLRDAVESDLVSKATTVSNEQAQALEDRLRQLSAEILKREGEIKDTKAERERILSGLPERVELDQLNEYYVEPMEERPGTFGLVESFNTALGSINFQKQHFNFAYVPSSKQLAWLKIGKEQTTENSELIKVWLDEAERAKVQLGYARQYRRTKPSDYGENTEAFT